MLRGWLVVLAATQVTAKHVDEIPKAHTPQADGKCGYENEMPPGVLQDCTDPIVKGAVDLRGMWMDEQGGRQRIEQCADRIIITMHGVVHDARADGTDENGFDDFSGKDLPDCVPTVHGIASIFSSTCHIIPGTATQPDGITRCLNSNKELVWTYGDNTPKTYQRMGPPYPTVCCEAATAQCLACGAGVTEEEYCKQKPDTNGCECVCAAEATEAECVGRCKQFWCQRKATQPYCSQDPQDPSGCCKALTAECLACAATVPVELYCRVLPQTAGCPQSRQLAAPGVATVSAGEEESGRIVRAVQDDKVTVSDCGVSALSVGSMATNIIQAVAIVTLSVLLCRGRTQPQGQAGVVGPGKSAELEGDFATSPPSSPSARLHNEQQPPQV